MSTGERILKQRKQAGLTQKALGKLCDMPDSQIRQYELGMVEPKINTIRRIATALNISIAELVDDWSVYSKEEIEADLENKSEKDLLDNYRKLNTSGQQKADNYVEDLTKIPEYRKED